MQSILTEERVKRLGSFNGIQVYKIKEEKFKTNTINVFFHDNLDRKKAAKNALIPAVLRRGCERFPTFQDIALYLEELYGASFDCGVAKKGESQIIQFYIEFVSDRYTGENKNLFEKAFDLLYEIITRPVLENGIFKNEYLEQEKENLRRLIESRVNDKVQYAVEKCFEVMCKDEPFGIYEYGAAEEVNGISSRGLYGHYVSFLESLPISIYVTGDIEDERIKAAAGKLNSIKRSSLVDIRKNQVDKQVKEVSNFTEKMNVNQGKLSIGFRTNTRADHKDYYALMVCNSILGGGMHSKLFQNVREKESLAYYAFSRLEKFKGLMVVSSGIESQNKDRTQDIVLRQLEEIKQGNISDYEFESSLKTIETGLQSLKDSQLQVVDFFLSQALAGTDDTLDTLVEKIKQVAKNDVVEVAKKIRLDTVYFLDTAEKK